MEQYLVNYQIYKRPLFKLSDQLYNKFSNQVFIQVFYPAMNYVRDLDNYQIEMLIYDQVIESIYDQVIESVVGYGTR